jgi:hypothetical protein
MNISRGKYVIAALLSLLAGPALAQSGYYGDHDDRRYDSSYQYGQRIRCESHDLRTNYCAADTRYGVRLLRQLSENPCREGRSWGADHRGIWVSQGCRGEFEVARRDHRRDDRYGRIRCESYDQRTRYCNADTRYGARLIRRLSDASCIQGRSWGWNNRGIWVSRGCRGEFEVRGRYGYGDNYPGNGQLLRCESEDGRYRACRSDRYARNVQLVRELSRASCDYNRSWGYRNGVVWVDRGCRAEFLIN